MDAAVQFVEDKNDVQRKERQNESNSDPRKQQSD